MYDNNSNIWEIAEAYVNGTLPETSITELKQRLETDASFAGDFNECANMLQSMQGNGKQKRFRAMLRDIHRKQSEVKPQGKKKLIQLPAYFWRTASVAAGVAILTSAITIWSFSPTIKKHDSQYTTISREMGAIKKAQAQQQAQQKQLIDIINKNSKPAPPPSDVKYSGTGFALTNDGYFVTADHLLHPDGKGDFDSVYIQNHEGQYFKASLIFFDHETDIAILKVDKKNFRFGKSEVPYTFATEKAGLGSKIFTMGFPADDIVFGEGYISSRNGFEGNPLQYSLWLPAGHGQSGSPVVDSRGNILGFLTAVSSEDEANTYAVGSKALLDLVHKMPDNSLHLPHSNKLGKLNREEQIEKMEYYTFSVKVYKK
jgi:serine protease Do